jgi:uncharacterized paraquat-inducible protein A
MGLEAMVEKYGMQRSHRRKFLEDVGVSLMIPQIEKRRNAYATAVGISNRLQMSFTYAGFPIHMPNKKRKETTEKQGSCHRCPRNLDKKSRIVCADCNKFLCKEHVQQRSVCVPSCN